MRRFNVVRTKIKIDFVDTVACALVINQRSGAKLRDCEKTRARHELVASLAEATARHKRRKWQARKVVPRQETLRGKIAIRIKVAFVDASSFGEQPNLDRKS